MTNYIESPVLAECIEIESVYTRAINLARDGGALELIAAYRPTSRTRQCLSQIAAGLTAEPRPRALAAIGPYGVGKSAFALFAGALLSDPHSEAAQTAGRVLRGVDSELADQITNAIASSSGYLRVAISGLPDSLQRQFLLALASAAEQASLDARLREKLLSQAEAGPPMDEVVRLLKQVQNAWKTAGGQGVLIEIDELGKFLEYAAFHPERPELHLLQLLAEHSCEPEPIPVQIIVLLHQAFEHYGARLGTELRDEWQKVQGRFETIAFLETAEQALRVLAAAFVRKPKLQELPKDIRERLAHVTALLAEQGALPHGLESAEAEELFTRCYPLHPFSLLILPTLCQKNAQNERTLFSYLGSGEPFGLQERLGRLTLGEWIWPWDLYDYFILNQNAGLGGPFADHCWAEVVTALERLEISAEDPNGPDLIALLKTIGLFNLIGAQRGFKASPALLKEMFKQLPALLERLQACSAIHFRQFSQDFRVWAGSDFDLRAALAEAIAAQAGRSLADTLNALTPLKPIIARRVTIDNGTLRAFIPRFTAAERWKPAPANPQELTLWFYLASAQEAQPPADLPSGILAFCPFTERLRELIDEWMALCELPKQQAALHQDPVAAREHRAWLSHAEQEAHQIIRSLTAEPERLRWFSDGKEQEINHRRDLQALLSDWVERHYNQTPRLNNELINRDAPSPSANLGRKRLIAAMLGAADKPGLGIEKTPAEKSLYLNLLDATRLHREENGHFGIYPPEPGADGGGDPCGLRPLWDAINETLGQSGERQVPLTELYTNLSRRPFGVKLGSLPVLIIAYLIAHQREVALYQERVLCDSLTLDQAELLCRRPDLFALERFDLGGLRGELFDRYLQSIIGRVPDDPSLLGIVRPLVSFLNGLPDYSQHCTDLSERAKDVRRAIQQATSPGTLLFEDLPRACDIPPRGLINLERTALEDFLNHLIEALRELKYAYSALRDDFQRQLAQALLYDPPEDLAELRKTIAGRYQGLEELTPDRRGLGAFILRLCDNRYDSDTAWLESVATLVANMPPAKWRDEHRREAALRLRARAEQVRDLDCLRGVASNASSPQAVLLKRVQSHQGEISHVIHLSSQEQERASIKAQDIAKQLSDIGPNEQLAVIAALLEQLSPQTPPAASTEGIVHD
ncbi:hypothetical protein Thiowin_02372 [Thiorhodovibrio winogradskyi]|uniref:ATP-binding protein n=1 Tax=Thiorhodovibrio winogradskyi TaxID=77007 RepID=A0ABZ0SCQ6_9GAMM|nr:hypothetical protein [Thiorhodovibrio winogradskyi]